MLPCLQVVCLERVARGFQPGRSAIPQGLKPNVFWPFSARLKSCPNTKPDSEGLFSFVWTIARTIEISNWFKKVAP